MATPVEPAADITLEELQLAARNHGMPLEALRYPVTPLGLHYLLTHYDIPYVDEASWRLRVDGLVRTPLSLMLEELQSRPLADVVATMECAGNGRARLSPRALSQPWLDEAVSTARWSGTPLAPLLREAGIRDGAVEVVFTGLDRGLEGGVELAFARSLPIDEALREDVLLAWAINGHVLPPQHGFPLRLVVPGWYGMTNVKWLGSITVSDTPFAGHQQATAYRLRQRPEEEGEALTRMRPHALMVPPGVPDFPTRRRTLPAGSHVLEGRAWSGFAPIARVDVSTDAGATWARAELGPASDAPFAWCGWRFPWDAPTGGAQLCCRAADAAGNEQPLTGAWNLGGYANNGVQRVVVNVV